MYIGETVENCLIGRPKKTVLSQLSFCWKGMSLVQVRRMVHYRVNDRGWNEGEGAFLLT